MSGTHNTQSHISLVSVANKTDTSWVGDYGPCQLITFNYGIEGLLLLVYYLGR